MSLKDSQKENAARIKQLKATKSSIAKKGKSSKAKSSLSSKVAVTGVSNRKRAEAAKRLTVIKEGMIILPSIHLSFFLNVFFPSVPAGINHKCTTSKPNPQAVEQLKPKETDTYSGFNLSLDVPMESAPLDDSMKAGNDIFHLNYSTFPSFLRLQ